MVMRVTRRVFLKISGTALAAGGIGINPHTLGRHNER
jgi:hypothetical protein